MRASAIMATAVLGAIERQGTVADMVQIGNEVNHGLLWPEGHSGNLDQLAGLLQAGVEGTEAVDPDMPVMMHIALGGQNDEARFWLSSGTPSAPGLGVPERRCPGTWLACTSSATPKVRRSQKWRAKTSSR